MSYLPEWFQNLRERQLAKHIDSMAPYREALEILSGSDRVSAILGPSARPLRKPVGSVRMRGPIGFVEWTVDVEGANGTGRLTGVANRVGQRWQISRLVFRDGKEGGVVDITPASGAKTQGFHAAGKVFVIFVGLPEELDLSWVPEICQRRLGVDVQLLAPEEVAPVSYDSSRHQVIAEEIVKQVLRSHPSEAKDPANTFLAITDKPMYIRDFAWKYSTALREDARYGVISTYQIREPADQRNPDLMVSRIEKMVLKNVAVLALRLPMSADATSLLSWPVSSGADVDSMTEEIEGANGRFIPRVAGGDPCISLTIAPSASPDWRAECHGDQRFGVETAFVETDLGIGLQTLYINDFDFGDELPFQFVRAMRPQDPRIRPFGLGGNDSLDIFLVGDMSTFTDLVGENGGRLHFKPDRLTLAEKYLADVDSDSIWYKATLTYSGTTWELKRRDGWKFYFPYRPDWPGGRVTILGGMMNPSGQKIEMVRDFKGNLMRVTTPSGRRLDITHNSAEEILQIDDSAGRSMRYEYDPAGHLTHALDIGGAEQFFTYDDGHHLLTMRNSRGQVVLTNSYSPKGDISQQMYAGDKRLNYAYMYDSSDKISSIKFRADDDCESVFRIFRSGFTQSFPGTPPTNY